MKFLKSLAPIVVATALSGGISYATFFTWSKTAATNATADATINWAEGMAPSAVNDSARAMMAATAKFRDDISGRLVTAGGAVAFTLTSNQVFTSLANMDGAELCFRMNATSGASPTLNVDTLGAKAINAVSGTAIPSGSLISGGVYCAVYNNASNEWLVKGAIGASLSAPSGASYVSSNGTCPAGWTKGVTHNDKALRLVTGAPTTGGTQAFSTVLAGSTQAFVLTTNEIPSHSHGVGSLTADAGGAHTPTVNGGSSFTPFVSGPGGSNITAGGGSGGLATFTFDAVGAHGHGISGSNGAIGNSAGHAHAIGVQFVDVVLCTKD